MWPGDWVKHTAKMNLAVGEKNCLDYYRDKKRLVCLFRRQEFWKFIVCILLTVTYGKNGHTIWGRNQIFVGNKAQTKLLRYFVRIQI